MPNGHLCPVCKTKLCLPSATTLCTPILRLCYAIFKTLYLRWYLLFVCILEFHAQKTPRWANIALRAVGLSVLRQCFLHFYTEAQLSLLFSGHWAGTLSILSVPFHRGFTLQLFFSSGEPFEKSIFCLVSLHFIILALEYRGKCIEIAWQCRRAPFEDRIAVYIVAGTVIE